MKRSLALVSVPLLLAVIGWTGHSNGQSELEMIRSEANSGDAGRSSCTAWPCWRGVTG